MLPAGRKMDGDQPVVGRHLADALSQVPAGLVVLVDDQFGWREYRDIVAQRIGRPSRELQHARSSEVLLALVATLIVTHGGGIDIGVLVTLERAHIGLGHMGHVELGAELPHLLELHRSSKRGRGVFEDELEIRWPHYPGIDQTSRKHHASKPRTRSAQLRAQQFRAQTGENRNRHNERYQYTR